MVSACLLLRTQPRDEANQYMLIVELCTATGEFLLKEWTRNDPIPREIAINWEDRRMGERL